MSIPASSCVWKSNNRPKILDAYQGAGVNESDVGKYQYVFSQSWDDKEELPIVAQQDPVTKQPNKKLKPAPDNEESLLYSSPDIEMANVPASAVNKVIVYENSVDIEADMGRQEEGGIELLPCDIDNPCYQSDLNAGHRERGTQQQVTVHPGAFAVAGPDASQCNGDDFTITAQLVSSLTDAGDPITAELYTDDDRQSDEERRERQLEERLANAPMAEVVSVQKCSQRMQRLIIGAIFIVAAVMLGIVLPPLVGPERPSSSQLLGPQQPSSSPGLIEILSAVSLDKGTALKTNSTPQNDAFLWLANNTNLGTYSSEKKIQWYSLATVYYSTNGNNWINKSGWLSDDDECHWYKNPYLFDDLCSYTGEVGKLHLGSNNLNGTIPNEIALLSNSLGKCLFKVWAFFPIYQMLQFQLNCYALLSVCTQKN